MVTWRRQLPVAVVGGLGLGLLVTSAAHHATEIEQINHTSGPLSAFLVDGVPAVALLTAGYWLSRTDLEAAHRWDVAVWCVLGSALFAGVTLSTILVREFEGRTVTEPAFPLLVSTGVGAVAGLVAGFFYVRAHLDTQRARRARSAFSFVNDVLRHDVRNNLGIIRGNAEAVAAATTDDAIAARADTIRVQTDDALQRIQQTDAIANTITGDADLEPVDLAAVAETAADLVADAYDVTVTTDLPEEAVVRANDGVQSVADNLVENAAEHNDADDPRVAVAVDVGADAVRLEVRDNGPGVDADVLEYLDEGGLALAETLVTHYGGDLRVADADSNGSTFVAELPRADAD